MLMLVALPIMMGVIVFSADPAVLKAVTTLDTRFLSDWMVRKSGVINPSVIKPVSLNKKGMIFEADITPKWEDTYGVFLHLPPTVGNSTLRKTHLFIEINRIDTEESSTPVLRVDNIYEIPTDNHKSRVFSLVDYVSKLPQFGDKHPLSLLSGITYRIRVTNKTEDNLAGDLPYRIEVSTNYKPK